MDPQLRLMLEIAYEAIVDGGEELQLILSTPVEDSNINESG